MLLLVRTGGGLWPRFRQRRHARAGVRRHRQQRLFLRVERQRGRETMCAARARATRARLAVENAAASPARAQRSCLFLECWEVSCSCIPWYSQPMPAVSGSPTCIVFLHNKLLISLESCAACQSYNMQRGPLGRVSFLCGLKLAVL